MDPVLAGVTLLVVAGSVIVVSVRDARAALLALAVVLVGSPLLADPPVAPLGLAARSIGAVLAVYLLWIATRGRGDPGGEPVPTEGSRIGWPADVLLAAAAGVAGATVLGPSGPGAGAGWPGAAGLAGAAGFALGVLSIAPILTGRDVLRIGLGLIVLVDAGSLIRAALGGSPTSFEQLLGAGLLVAVAGVLAALVMAARVEGTAGLALVADSRPAGRRSSDVRPIGPG